MSSTKIINLNLPARILKAAHMMQSKNDFRYYLNGIHVNSERIAATDGHTIFINYSKTWSADFHNKYPENGYIINIQGKIPGAAHSATFNEADDSIGIVVYRNTAGKIISRELFSTIEGKYPDTNKIDNRDRVTSINNVSYNPLYLSKCAMALSSIQNGEKWKRATVSFCGDTIETLMQYEYKHAEYGICKCLIMPIAVNKM